MSVYNCGLTPRCRAPRRALGRMLAVEETALADVAEQGQVAEVIEEVLAACEQSEGEPPGATAEVAEGDVELKVEEEAEEAAAPAAPATPAEADATADSAAAAAARRKKPHVPYSQREVRAIIISPGFFLFHTRM